MLLHKWAKIGEEIGIKNWKIFDYKISVLRKITKFSHKVCLTMMHMVALSKFQWFYFHFWREKKYATSLCQIFQSAYNTCPRLIWFWKFLPKDSTVLVHGVINIRQHFVLPKVCNMYKSGHVDWISRGRNAATKAVEAIASFCPHYSSLWK